MHSPLAAQAMHSVLASAHVGALGAGGCVGSLNNDDGSGSNGPGVVLGSHFLIAFSNNSRALGVLSSPA